MASSVRASRRLSFVLMLAVIAAVGLLPSTPAGADEGRERRRDIVIAKNSEFDAAHGVRSGSGTADDPYVISGWDVNSLVIRDTSAHVMIVDNTVRSSMVLNWIGDGAHVHDNDVHDLRVNQNVRRTGEATSGEISGNDFFVVGQLRHWDGVFENNVVGQTNNSDAFGALFKRRAVNFDGFNGAIFRNNTIYGYMDARLHGHHHSSGFGESSHYHGTEPQQHEHSQPTTMPDHTQRYHEVWITDNKIYSEYSYGLAYLDTAHAANDRTAASETDQSLNAPHVHYTRVHLTGNELTGGGIAVQVFNAADQRHTATAPGLVEIVNNRITLADNDASPFSSLNGIRADSARDLALHIMGNEIATQPRQMDPLSLETNNDRGAGIFLSNFDKGDIHIDDNKVSGRYYGIRASRFTETVRWVLGDLTLSGCKQAVAWDSSVKNSPETEEGAQPASCQ